jgi:Ca2+-binding EF-hand superfamily protein
MEARKDQSLAFEELVAILLQVYFVEILIKRRYQTNQTVEWKTRRISREEFILLITEGCFFIRLIPQRADLVIIFNMIDENKDGYISFQEYFNFIRKYLGNGYELPDVEENKSKKMNNMNSSRHGNVPSNVSNEEWEFIQLIWGELK